MKKWYSIVFLIGLMVVFLMGSGNAATVSSDFNSSADDWKLLDLNLITGATRDDSGNFAHFGTDGNPAGYIRGADQTFDQWMVFSAPGKFLGSKAGYYSGSLQFDLLRNSDTEGQSYFDVAIVGAGKAIYHVGNAPAAYGTWTSTVVNLSESGWFLNSYDSGIMLLSSDFIATISDIQAIYINGDWKTGFDNIGLDNVKLSSVPIPSALWLLGSGLIGFTGISRRKI